MARKRKASDLTHCKVKRTSQERAPFRVWFPIEDDGGKLRRKFKSFADEESAWNFAEDKDREISNHGARYGDIPPKAHRAYDFFRDEKAELEADGVFVPKCEDMVADAMASIRAAHASNTTRSMLIADAVAQFTDYKLTRVGALQLTDIKTRLKRFAQDFGTRSMKSITTTEIDAWLSALRSRRSKGDHEVSPLLSPLSRNHYRATLHAFFSYGTAPARAWLERNPVADLEPERFNTEEPEAYSPEDARKIMHTALDEKPELVPVLALGFFAGLRVSEAAAIDLGKLPMNAIEFRTTGKTGARMAPFTPACKAWLNTVERSSGKAWRKSPSMLWDALKEVYALAKVSPITNGARHSFISYRTAETRDVARVADECGNSVSTIKNHYRQLVTAEAAKQYFEILPEQSPGEGKIVDLETRKANA